MKQHEACADVVQDFLLCALFGDATPHFKERRAPRALRMSNDRQLWRAVVCWITGGTLLRQGHDRVLFRRTLAELCRRRAGVAEVMAQAAKDDEGRLLERRQAKLFRALARAIEDSSGRRRRKGRR